MSELPPPDPAWRVPPPPPPPPPRPELPLATVRTPAWTWITLAGAAATILGAFLPWVEATIVLVGSVSRNGVDGGGDGVLTIGLALAAAAVAAFTRYAGSDTPLGVVIAAFGAGITAIGAYDWSHVADRIDEVRDYGVASVGSGLYLTVAGGAVILVAGIIRAVQGRP